ncbi:MAG: peptidase domain-containing ABC transporter [Desulfovibrionales bacterium]|nr:peptidase domain-containing ABC transporter [Desulfovibrionales bacterium]
MGSMMQPGARTVRCRGEHALWILGSLCQMFRIPFDQGLAALHCPPCCGEEHLQRMLQAFGFTAGMRSMSPGKLATAPMPVIGFLRGSDQQRPGHDPGSKPNAEVERGIPVLIVRADQENLLLFRPGSHHPETLPLSEAGTSLDSHVLLLGRKLPVDAGLDPEARVNALGDTKFGFRWFIPELLNFKCIWRDVLTASLFIQLIGLGTPLFTQVVIDKVVAHQARNTLFVVATGMAVFMAFGSLMTWLRQYLILHTGTRIDATLCCKVFAHLVRLPMPYFEARPTGTLVARIQGVESIRQFVSGAAVTLLLDCPFLLVFMAVMFWYSWQLSLVALGILLLIALLSALVTPVFRRRVNRQFLLGARNQAFMTEYLAGMDTVKALQMESGLEERYGEYLAAYLGAGFATRQLANSYNVAANLLEQTMTLSILGVGALLVMGHNGFTIGQLVAFQMFAARMSQPMLRLVGLWQEFQQANIAVKRLGDIMDMPAEPHGLVPSRLRNTQPGRVEFRDVSFRYGPGQPYVFRNLSLAFESGKLNVLMGPSGCGKSTLAKLLLGFWPPADGRVSIDGRDIRHMSANELRMLFGVVPQDTVLFSGTIYDNLLHPNPHAGFADVVMACRHAGIHEVIEALPQGYQTELGEHGVGLSGGQRQRIAIARALLKRPRILIFDEATSGLDQLAAERFAATVNSLKGQATVIFITHQVPTGLQADELFRFEPGRAEQGSGCQS